MSTNVRKTLLLALAVALFCRVFIVEFRNLGFSPGWGAEMVAVATALAEGRGYSDPYRVPTGATATQSPIYPFLLSLPFRIFGPAAYPSGMLILYFQALVSALIVFPVFAMGKRLFDERSGLASALLWALTPVTGHTEARYVTTASLLALLVAILVWRTTQISRETPATTWALHWILAGVLVLVDPSGLVYVACAGLWIWIFRDRRVARCALAALCFLAVVGPWMARNWIVFGRPMLRSNLGLNLARGIQEEDYARLDSKVRLPTSDPEELKKYIALGEMGYMQDKLAQVKKFVGENPAEYARIAGRRFVAYWAGNAELTYIYYPPWHFGAAKHFVYLLPVWGALAGMILLYRRRAQEFWLFVLILALAPAVYYFTSTTVRYRSMLEPMLFVLTGGFLIGAAQAWRERRSAVGASSPGIPG